MKNVILKILSGPKQGQTQSLRGLNELRIGRKRGDLLIEDPLMSSSHARLYHKQESWYIQDLGSTNGTLLEGKLIKDSRLHLGSEITLGNSNILLTTEEKAQKTPARSNASRLEIAWLLDEELFLLEKEQPSPANQIDNALRVPPSLKAVLEVISGQDQGKLFHCKTGNINIGRKIGEVALNDQEVSRRHAIIELRTR